MRQVLLVQGGGEKVHDEWDNLLADSLQGALGENYEVRYPRLPDEADPHYATWSKVLRRELASLDHGTILVAHSLGGTVLVNLLAAETFDKRFAALHLLAAPFAGPGGWPNEEIEARPQLGDDLPDGLAVTVWHGSADEEVPPAHAALYGKAIPQATIRMVECGKHQFNNDLSAVAAVIESLVD